MRDITNETVQLFEKYLINEEKSKATVDKYMHDLNKFRNWLGTQESSKMAVLAYKAILCERYAPASVNVALSSLNCFFNFMEWYDLRVKNLRMQRPMFASADKELTKAEYDRLLQMAKMKKNKRLYFLMQTICSTSIRVSEVCYITVETALSNAFTICEGL